MKSGLNKVLAVIAKIVEVVHWISIPFSILLIVLSLTSNPFIQGIAGSGFNDNLNCYGFIISNLANSVDSSGIIFALVFLGAGTASVFMALIFRNIYTVLRTIEGKNKKTESTSPFQKLVVDCIKKIGVFAIAIPVVGLVMTVMIAVVSLVSGAAISVTLSTNSVIIGLICLSLAQVFAYGAKLEDEVDGLL